MACVVFPTDWIGLIPAHIHTVDTQGKDRWENVFFAGLWVLNVTEKSWVTTVSLCIVG